MEETSSSFLADQKRYAVVTGANKGIGLEICRQLALSGIIVTLTARDEKRGIKAVEYLNESGLSNVFFHQLDVKDPISITSLANFIETHLKKLDILVNNAGDNGLIVDEEALKALTIAGGQMKDENSNLLRGIVEETYDRTEECLKTNYYGAKHVTEALLPLLQLSDSPRIVNVSSVYGQLKFISNEKIKEELSNVDCLTVERLDELVQWFLRDFKEGKLHVNGWPITISAYKVSKAALNGLLHVNWSKLWDTNGVAPRIITFIWKALHEGIAVNASLGRILHKNGSCTRCNYPSETASHVLLHCPKAIEIWEASSVRLPANLKHQNLTEFISHLMKEDVDTFRKGCAILWTIWKARNNWTFNQKETQINVLVHQANQLYLDYKHPTVPTAGPQQQQQTNPTTRQLHWTLPCHGQVKVNIDGACSQGKIAAGTLVRDHTGAFLGGATKVGSFGSPIEAEAMALTLAMDVIQRLSLNNVLIEGDSMNIIDSINNSGQECDWRIRHMITECQNFLAQRSDIRISYSPRTTNTVAHCLAQHAITVNVSETWLGGLPPPFLLDTLFADLAPNVSNIPINE